MSQSMRVVLLLPIAVLAGCSGSTAPPEVAAVPVVAEESSRPKAAPALRNLDAALSTNATDARIPDGGSFAFPKDAGGTALSKSLPPARPAVDPWPASSGPRDRRVPDALSSPAAPIPGAPDVVPRLPTPMASAVRPAPLSDRVPLDFGGRFPDLPSRGELPTGSLTRTERRDPSRPPDLPHLATRPVPDRAPLTDPTLEFTAASVISAVLPLRVGSAPFVRHNVPNPFEHADDARLRTPVVEDPNRALGTVPPPRRD
jgi:hypothetical protein